MGKIYACELPHELKKSKTAYSHVNGISLGKLNTLRNTIGEGLKTNAFIRVTNPGSVDGFERRYAVGKPLAAKAKSSDGAFCKANLAACPALAKNYKGSKDKAGIIKSLKGSIPRKDGMQFKRVHKHIFTCQGSALDTAINRKKHLKNWSTNHQFHEAFYFHEKRRDLHFHYLLVENDQETHGLPQSILCEKFKKRPQLLLKPNERNVRAGNLHLYSVYVSIDGFTKPSDYSVFGDDIKPLSIHHNSGTRKYYPLLVLAEPWSQEAWKPKANYEMVADYDLFAVCPSMELVKERKWDLSYFTPKTIAEPLWLNRYDTGIVPEELGFLSEFDNKVRQQINHVFKIPVARHGCEVNNLFYTSDLDTIEDVISIESKSTRASTPNIRSFKSYLRLNKISLESHKPFFIPLNPNWMNWTDKDRSRLKKFWYTISKGRSTAKLLAWIVKNQIGVTKKGAIVPAAVMESRALYVKLAKLMFEAQLICDKSHYENEGEYKLDKRAIRRKKAYVAIQETLAKFDK